MSYQLIFVTLVIPIIYIFVITAVVSKNIVINSLNLFLIKGEDKIDYYFEILDLKFSKEEWVLRRLLASIMLTVLITYAFLRTKLYLSIIVLIVIYKYFYLDLYIRYLNKIKKINRELPYFLKMVINGCYFRPLLGSLISSREYVFDEFRSDLDKLITDIDDNPKSYLPYETLINRYNNKIKHLDTYLKSLYRLSQTADNQSGELLETLSKMVSDDVNIVRAEKNSVFNSSLSYLGLIPVFFLTIAISAVLLLSVTNII